MVIPPILVLDRALRNAGIPIDGVSMGTPLDRSTWVAIYNKTATPAQMAAGDQILATFDPQDPVTVAELKQEAVAGMNTDLLQAIATALWECIPAPLMTKVQLKARIVAIYKTL